MRPRVLLVTANGMMVVWRLMGWAVPPSRSEMHGFPAPSPEAGFAAASPSWPTRRRFSAFGAAFLDC